VWVFGDGSGNRLTVFLMDSTGRQRAYELGYLDFSGWRKLTVRLGSPTDPQAEAPAYPVSFAWLGLEPAIWHPKIAASGTIYFDELSVAFAVPESKSMELRVDSGPNSVFERPREPVEVHLAIRNLVPVARTGLHVVCAVKDEDGQAIKEFTQAFDLAASEEKALTFTATPRKIGSYHLEAKLTGGGLSLENSTVFSVGLPSG
jgi:hypothetical protein